MTILAIDPGPVQSGYVVWDGELHACGIESNQELVVWLRGDVQNLRAVSDVLVVEEVRSYGMPVGREVFETVWWSGRFAEAFGADETYRLPRLAVKQHLCHDSRAKDGNIRQALIDRFGPPGTKKSPGLLHGVHGDAWAALALAVTYWDQRCARGIREGTNA